MTAPALAVHHVRVDLDAAYRLLGVDRPSTVDEARAHFRERAKRVHPDRGGETEAAVELFDAWRLVEADLRLRPAARPWLRRPAEHECEVCGTSPAANLTLRRVVGLLVVSPVIQARARVCVACARSATAEWQALTLIRGWWSIFGLVVTPFVFATNVVTVRAHRRRAAGPVRRDPFLDVPEGAPLPYRSTLRLPVVAACLPAAALLALVVIR